MKILKAIRTPMKKLIGCNMSVLTPHHPPSGGGDGADCHQETLPISGAVRSSVACRRSGMKLMSNVVPMKASHNTR